jgi:hypothetical protein
MLTLNGGGGGGGSDGGGVGGGSDGGGYVERARGEEIGVTRMQVRVPRIHIGDNLAQIKAMRLANVQTFGSQCFASKQSKKEIWLRRSQIYRGAQIEKWSFCMCSCVISQRNHDFTERLRR